jgi:hypothetical protein
MGLSIRSRKPWTKPTFLPPIDAASNPYPPLDLRSEPVFLNGSPPDEQDDAAIDHAPHAAEQVGSQYPTP